MIGAMMDGIRIGLVLATLLIGIWQLPALALRLAWRLAVHLTARRRGVDGREAPSYDDPPA